MVAPPGRVTNKNYASYVVSTWWHNQVVVMDQTTRWWRNPEYISSYMVLPGKDACFYLKLAFTFVELFDCNANQIANAASSFFLVTPMQLATRHDSTKERSNALGFRRAI